MDIMLWVSIVFSLFIVVSIGIVLYKRLIQKKSINNYYTPFDNITGQTSSAFHDEKLEKEVNNAEGDDKDKNEPSIV
ncbi:DUF3951 domain-containing protein [Heyndrickxia sp. NPDC080065]|uniref:DUF3951 domain-containing protein n=1 Tax=Heyndrickxia sp. NPDC080065 TaxID=3390568 RepID=UPI003CFE453C